MTHEKNQIDIKKLIATISLIAGAMLMLYGFWETGVYVFSLQAHDYANYAKSATSFLVGVSATISGMLCILLWLILK